MEKYYGLLFTISSKTRTTDISTGDVSKAHSPASQKDQVLVSRTRLLDNGSQLCQYSCAG